MSTDSLITEIMPGLTREMLEDRRIVVWTFALPPIPDEQATSISTAYLEKTLRPLAQAWMTAARETLIAWPKDKPYLALHDLPTLAQLVRATALKNLVGLDIRSIWINRNAARDAALPQPIWWRLAVILNPQLSAHLNWIIAQPAEKANTHQIFLAEDEASRQQAREEALAWLKKDESFSSSGA
jgi:hypothetical protein